LRLFAGDHVGAVSDRTLSAGGKQGGSSIKRWSNSPKSRSLAAGGAATALVGSSSPPHASPKLRRRSSPAASAAVLGRRVDTTSTGSGGTRPALRLARLWLGGAACRRRGLDLRRAELETGADGAGHTTPLGSSSAQRVEVACKGTGTLKGSGHIVSPTAFARDSKCAAELSRRAQPRATAWCSVGCWSCTNGSCAWSCSPPPPNDGMTLPREWCDGRATWPSRAGACPGGTRSAGGGVGRSATAEAPHGSAHISASASTSDGVICSCGRNSGTCGRASSCRTAS
jgi:hypothetical protein